MVTYVTGCQRLTPRRTYCKHLLNDATGNPFLDRISLRNSGGGAITFSAISLKVADKLGIYRKSKVFCMQNVVIEK